MKMHDGAGYADIRTHALRHVRASAGTDLVERWWDDTPSATAGEAAERRLILLSTPGRRGRPGRPSPEAPGLDHCRNVCMAEPVMEWTRLAGRRRKIVLRADNYPYSAPRRRAKAQFSTAFGR